MNSFIQNNLRLYGIIIVKKERFSGVQLCKGVMLLKRKIMAFIVGIGLALTATACGKTPGYALKEYHEVDGRQGVACSEEGFFVSGSTTLSYYDSNWTLQETNADPFADFEKEENHIGDIDYYNGNIYAGVEYFMDGVAKNIAIAIYDGKTMTLKSYFPFEESSGQTECSGITVDKDNNSVWMCSWEEKESGEYLYRYDLTSGEYLGKYHMQESPKLIQGIVYHEGYIYITSDDGDADKDEYDNIYRAKVDLSKDSFDVEKALTLDSVERAGEIEGLSFDNSGNLLVLNNRGAIIVKGMPKGFYEGYDKEIHEVYILSEA